VQTVSAEVQVIGYMERDGARICGEDRFTLRELALAAEQAVAADALCGTRSGAFYDVILCPLLYRS
jgi:hypothetical protein